MRTILNSKVCLAIVLIGSAVCAAQESELESAVEYAAETSDRSAEDSAEKSAIKDFPYIVHVDSNGATLRSGPGDEYYATSKLASGTSLEVWRRTREGWLAVRPPRESFSLVSARDVHLRPGGMAQAVRPEVPVRIGSEVGDELDVVQVLLEQGEPVQVLDTVRLKGQLWYRIAPPSGEFRWIHADVVTVAARRAGPVDATSAATATTVVTSATSDAAITVADIELELSMIIAEDPDLWDFSYLRKRCEELRRAPNSDVDDQAIDELLGRIDRFERIRARRRAIVQPPQKQQAAEARSLPSDRPETGNDLDGRQDSRAGWREVRGEAPTEPATAASAETATEVVRIPEQAADLTEKRFDGIGTLRPVVSRRREAPRYALVNPTGDVLTFVTPSPGVNLQPYMGQRIGIIGTRGYMPEFKRPHVTAARVAPLR